MVTPLNASEVPRPVGHGMLGPLEIAIFFSAFFSTVLNALVYVGTL